MQLTFDYCKPFVLSTDTFATCLIYSKPLISAVNLFLKNATDTEALYPMLKMTVPSREII
jgi:hypothetical protein